MNTQQRVRELGPQQARIYLAIRSEIDYGRLEPGHMLASQSQLARQYGVALATLHSALRALEEDGYIVRRQGVGTFVASVLPTPKNPLRALAQFSTRRYSSASHAIDAALQLLAKQSGMRSAFLSRFDHDRLLIVADYDQGGCGIRAGASFPVNDAF